MDINTESRDRILAAAQQLFDQSGRLELPTVDAVRRLSKTNMNDASAVMKEWRRLRIASATAVTVEVPARVASASMAALSTLWSEAQALANEGLNIAQAAWDAERADAEKLRVELASAFETQGAELEAVKGTLATVESEAASAASAADTERAELLRQVAALTDSAHTASARAQELEKRADDLKMALGAAQAAAERATAELTAERVQHAMTRERVAAVSVDLAAVQARAEAALSVLSDQAARLKHQETELAQARAAAATAREETAQLRGQAELMDVLKQHEAGRPKGSKK